MKKNCRVGYAISQTPLISKIYPSTVFPGQDFCVNLFGDLAGSGGKQILKSIRTCGYTINTKFNEANSQTDISSNYNQICATLGGVMATPECQLKITGDTGHAWIEELARTSDGEQEFTLRTVAKVTGISSNELYKNPGSIVTVTGVGFDPIAENNEVQVDDLTCDVIEATSETITCQLPEKVSGTTSSVYIGGTGAHVKEFAGVNSGSVSWSASPTRATLFTDLQSVKGNHYIGGHFGRKLETWFIAPKDGDYVFHAN
jgi:hypothetical protein